MSEFLSSKSYIISRISDSRIGQEPYSHLYVDQILPPQLFSTMDAKARELESGGNLQRRTQDSKAFVNRRFSYARRRDADIDLFYRLFSDRDIKRALLEKFYLGDIGSLAESLCIHEKEFEFTFTEPGRFQNIHVDIPPKYLSLVFYFPNGQVDSEDELRNATVLYDKSLTPQNKARFRANTVCAFAPHFYSYHGFATTIPRTAFVLFYINKFELWQWNLIVRSWRDKAPFDAFKNRLQKKLIAHPLLEYGSDEQRVLLERAECQINAPLGRVLR